MIGAFKFDVSASVSRGAGRRSGRLLLGEIGSRSVGMALFLDAILEDGLTADSRG